MGGKKEPHICWPAYISQLWATLLFQSQEQIPAMFVGRRPPRRMAASCSSVDG